MKRFEIWLVQLDPVLGAEMRKTRPAVIVSPDELNDRLDTLIAASLTSAQKPWPWRVSSTFKGKPGQIALDQLRSLSKKRFRKRLGRLGADEGQQVLAALSHLFIP